jgi:hypothetical protein
VALPLTAKGYPFVYISNSLKSTHSGGNGSKSGLEFTSWMFHKWYIIFLMIWRWSLFAPKQFVNE